MYGSTSEAGISGISDMEVDVVGKVVPSIVLLGRSFLMSTLGKDRKPGKALGTYPNGTDLGRV